MTRGIVKARFLVGGLCAVAATLLAASACSSHTSEGATPDAITETVTDRGATLVIDDVMLEIPPGALSTPQVVTITRTNDPAPSGYDAVTSLYRFEPDGLVFAIPAKLIITVPSTAANASVIWLQAPDTYEPLATTTTAARARADILHFSGGFLGTSACEHAASCVVESAKCTFFTARCDADHHREARNDCDCVGAHWRCVTRERDCERVDAGPDAMSADANARDGGGPTPTSCVAGGDGLTNCGPSGTESCCASPLVTGGTFSRGYDGFMSSSYGYTDPKYRATVADFRLDRYEVTVGRYRGFVGAALGGWRPPPGSGKHAHLSGGGLTTESGTEPGWNAVWNSNFPSTQAAWESAYLGRCGSGGTSWTSTPSTKERFPITCVNWYQAVAFCIWDGGFLPSEAEWNYAAAGGAEQRAFPWSTAFPPGSLAISSANAVYCGTDCYVTRSVGSKSPAGDGRWGQADLAGNVLEWMLDGNDIEPLGPYHDTSCTNCAYLSSGAWKVLRGGGTGKDNAVGADGAPADPDYLFLLAAARP
jgi:formylglycine-generating enzyme required for sulfatase activity